MIEVVVVFGLITVEVTAIIVLVTWLTRDTEDEMDREVRTDDDYEPTPPSTVYLVNETGEMARVTREAVEYGPRGPRAMPPRITIETKYKKVIIYGQRSTVIDSLSAAGYRRFDASEPPPRPLLEMDAEVKRQIGKLHERIDLVVREVKRGRMATVTDGGEVGVFMSELEWEGVLNRLLTPFGRDPSSYWSGIIRKVETAVEFAEKARVERGG